MCGPRDPGRAGGSKYAGESPKCGERAAARCGILPANLIHPMATLSDRLPLNVAGRFYVDSSCIDCDQCRNEAPEFFGRDADSGTSYLIRQPDTAEEVALVQQAAANCATGSIGDDGA